MNPTSASFFTCKLPNGALWNFIQSTLTIKDPNYAEPAAIHGDDDF
jgi:hypothetical protein